MALTPEQLDEAVELARGEQDTRRRWCAWAFHVLDEAVTAARADAVASGQDADIVPDAADLVVLLCQR